VRLNNLTPLTWKRIFFTFAIVVIASVIRLLLSDEFGSKLPWITFYPAVAVISLYGGVFSGLLALALSSAIIILLIPVSKQISYIGAYTDWVGLLTFIVICLLISISSEIMHKANNEAEREKTLSLLASEEKHRAIFEQASVGIANVSIENRFLYVNKKYCEIVGYEEEELLKLKFSDITHPDDIDISISSVKPLIEGTLNTFSTEKRYVKKDGSIIWVDLKTSLIRSDEGQALYFSSFIQDISDRKATEEALIESLKRLDRAERASHLGSWELDLLNDEVIWSDEYYRICGFTKQIDIPSIELVIERVHPEDRSKVISAIDSAKNSGIPYNMEIRILYPDGTHRHVNSIGELVFNEDNKPIKLIGSYLDITERKNVSDELNKALRFNKDIISNVNEGIIVYDENLKYVVWNPFMEKISGRKAVDVIGLTPEENVPQLVKLGLVDTLKLALKGQATTTTDVPYFFSNKNSDGFVTFSCGPMFNDEGEIVGVIATTQDITDRRLAEERVLFNSNHDSLTGLFNRRYFDEVFDKLYSSNEVPISIIIGDVNGLKLSNDIFGHICGDIVLKKIGKIMKSELGEGNCVARISGDEFVAVLVGVTFIEANKLTENIRKRCKEETTDEINLNISFGVETKTETSQNLLKCYHLAEERMYTSKLLEGKNIRSSIIENLRVVLEEKTGETRSHCERMAKTAEKLGVDLGLQRYEIENLKLLAILHDIGKTAIPDNILLKPGALDDEEMTKIKKHSELGYRIANNLPELVIISNGILCHHERWDGAGYPQGLKEEEIPLNARIVSIVDAYDAMTNDRPYRKAMSNEVALEEIRRCAGTQFDPEIVEIFLTKTIVV